MSGQIPILIDLRAFVTHFDYFRDLQRLQPVDRSVKDSNIPFFIFIQS